MRVRDVMQRDVVSVTPHTPLEELERLLLKHHVSGMPVLEHGRLVGLVTRSDVVRQLLVAQSMAYSVTHSYRDLTGISGKTNGSSDTDLKEVEIIRSRLAGVEVADVMTDNVITVSASDSVVDAAEAMINRGIHRLLVVEDGKLVGLVTSLDLVGLLLESGPRHEDTTPQRITHAQIHNRARDQAHRRAIGEH